MITTLKKDDNKNEHLLRRSIDIVFFPPFH